MIWNQPVDLAEGQRVRWHVGPRTLWVERALGEWRIGAREAERDDIDTASMDHERDESDGPALLRCAIPAKASGRLRLVPRPPDRPLVARAEIPLHIPAGSTTHVFVGVPLWASLTAEGTPIHELPLITLSDTWFGTPLEGTLCYATRTSLTIDEQVLTRRPHRAVCRVEIINHGATPLELERVRVPAPMLSLWQSEGRQLRTAGVRLKRDTGEDMGTVDVLGSPGGGAEHLADSRVDVASGRVVKAFNAVWKNLAGWA